MHDTNFSGAPNADAGSENSPPSGTAARGPTARDKWPATSSGSCDPSAPPELRPFRGAGRMGARLLAPVLAAAIALAVGRRLPVGQAGDEQQQRPEDAGPGDTQ